MSFGGYYSSSLSQWLCPAFISILPGEEEETGSPPHLSFLSHILIDYPSIHCAYLLFSGQPASPIFVS